MENKDTGILLNKTNIQIHRKYFKEMVKLLGIQCLYKSVIKNNKTYDDHGELDTSYNNPIVVGCIFDEHPTQYTMKKLGWNSELSTATSIIHVPYDLKDLEVGCLFIVPSGLDNAKGRVFKVIKMSTIAVYPASIACEIGPVYKDDIERSNLHDFSTDDFTLIKEEER